MTGAGTQPFRFLDLPKELRLMVYERLPITTRHHGLIDPTYHRKDQNDPASKIVIVKKSAPVALLVTCRMINAEARPYLAPLLQKLSEDPLRSIVDTASLGFFDTLLLVIEDFLNEKENYNEQFFGQDYARLLRYTISTVYQSRSAHIEEIAEIIYNDLEPAMKSCSMRGSKCLIAVRDHAGNPVNQWTDPGHWGNGHDLFLDLLSSLDITEISPFGVLGMTDNWEAPERSFINQVVFEYSRRRSNGNMVAEESSAADMARQWNEGDSY